MLAIYDDNVLNMPLDFFQKYDFYNWESAFNFIL